MGNHYPHPCYCFSIKLSFVIHDIHPRRMVSSMHEHELFLSTYLFIFYSLKGLFSFSSRNLKQSKIQRQIGRRSWVGWVHVFRFMIKLGFLRPSNFLATSLTDDIFFLNFSFMVIFFVSSNGQSLANQPIMHAMQATLFKASDQIRKNKECKLSQQQLKMKKKKEQEKASGPVWLVEKKAVRNNQIHPTNEEEKIH